MLSFLRYQFPAIVWIASIFAISAVPTSFWESLGIQQSWAPKVVHVVIFFFLCFFFVRAFKHQQAFPFLSRNSLTMSVLLCVSFGILDEVQQIFVAGRHPRLTDVLLDLFGASLMAGSLWVWDRIRPARRQEPAR
jgi:VanZ family protein